jgi:hypothetical protein
MVPKVSSTYKILAWTFRVFDKGGPQLWGWDRRCSPPKAPVLKELQQVALLRGAWTNRALTSVD